jgi:hypothetical protein
MNTQDMDIVQAFHFRDSTVKDAIEHCSRRHTEHAEEEARVRLEAMLHRCSDEMTERARKARLTQP